MVARIARRFDAAKLHFGHGTDNASDEALFLLLHALGWSYEIDPETYGQALTAAQVAAVEAIADQRIESRQPAAYLTERMWFAGYEFFVDKRVLVPRSPLAELLIRELQPWRGERQFQRILDIGTGSGCIAIAAALLFPRSAVTATDICEDALQVAQINRRNHGLEARLQLVKADLFPSAVGAYDLIISNPPYVPSAAVEALPAEYHAEPASGLDAGHDGFACVERILHEAREYLTADGLLVVEVGEIWRDVAARFPEIPFTWAAFEYGGEGVFILDREDLGSLA